MQSHPIDLHPPRAQSSTASGAPGYFWPSLALAAGLTLTLTAPAPAHAAEPSTHATAALATLLGPMGQIQQMGNAPPTTTLQAMAASAASASPGPASGVKARATVTAQRGETLDRLIRRALPGMPLHPDLLRQAFVQLNPQVFPKGTMHAMRAGTALVVPGSEDLLDLLKTKHPEFMALMVVKKDAPESAESVKVDQRRWVRFP